MKRKLLAPFVVFALGCLLTAGVAFTLFTTLDTQLEYKFENDTNQIVSLVEGRMNIYTNAVYGARAMFGASTEVTSDDWNAYVQGLDLTKNYRGISSMLFIKRVPRSEVDAQPFSIHPFTEKAEYYPITYSFSTTPATTSALGFDASSEPGRNSALVRARDTDEPAATPVVAAASTGLPVFSIYLAAYPIGVTHVSENIIGYVTATFRVKELFEGLAADPAFVRDIDVRITDSDGSVLLDTGISRSGGSSEGGLSRTVPVQIGGRTWNMELWSLSGYSLGAFASIFPWIVLVAGVLLSLLVAAVMYSLTTARERALALAKNMTASLNEEKAKAEAILGSIGEGVAFADTAGKLVYWNEAANRILGTKMENTLSKDWEARYGVYYPDEKTPMPGEAQALALALKGQTIDNMPEFIRHPELPEGRHIGVSAKPVALKDGTGLGAVAIFRDVTKEYEIDKAKTEFVSLASHQLRTPLTSIKWYAELLEEEAGETLSPDQKEYVHEIRSAMERMNALVAALLDVSRLDLGTFIIEPASADLVEVVSTAVKEQEPTFKTKKQTFSFVRPKALPGVMLDTKLMFIVVQNLLSNAHKYSPEGAAITLTLAQDKDGAYVITCADTGYGIPKAEQENMFKKLFRAENIKSLEVEGTGLGLYVIKTIIDAAGCSITFVSEEGKGTTFTVRIPKEGMKRKEGTRSLSGNSVS